MIYVDPPWSYRQSGGRGTAKSHYDTMGVEDIKNLPVLGLASPDCILFLWATFPCIAEALEVMQHWGFVYKTAAFVWVKKNKGGGNFCGMGAYTRANAEVCLLGVRPGTKASKAVKCHSVRQVIESPIERHSKKPDETRDRIEKLLGDIPKIELFARQEANGWDCWGEEV